MTQIAARVCARARVSAMVPPARSDDADPRWAQRVRDSPLFLQNGIAHLDNFSLVLPWNDQERPASGPTSSIHGEPLSSGVHGQKGAWAGPWLPCHATAHCLRGAPKCTQNTDLGWAGLGPAMASEGAC